MGLLSVAIMRGRKPSLVASSLSKDTSSTRRPADDTSIGNSRRDPVVAAIEQLRNVELLAQYRGQP